jgi:hypothetical protein
MYIVNGGFMNTVTMTGVVECVHKHATYATFTLQSMESVYDAELGENRVQKVPFSCYVKKLNMHFMDLMFYGSVVFVTGRMMNRDGKYSIDVTYIERLSNHIGGRDYVVPDRPRLDMDDDPKHFSVYDSSSEEMLPDFYLEAMNAE